ncbi:MAG: hypothetical protein ACE5IK_01650 [Acidobacteriota bacterium]
MRGRQVVEDVRRIWQGIRWFRAAAGRSVRLDLGLAWLEARQPAVEMGEICGYHAAVTDVSAAPRDVELVLEFVSPAGTRPPGARLVTPIVTRPHGRRQVEWTTDRARVAWARSGAQRLSCRIQTAQAVPVDHDVLLTLRAGGRVVDRVTVRQRVLPASA